MGQKGWKGKRKSAPHKKRPIPHKITLNSNSILALKMSFPSRAAILPLRHNTASVIAPIEINSRKYPSIAKGGALGSVLALGWIPIQKHD